MYIDRVIIRNIFLNIQKIKNFAKYLLIPLKKSSTLEITTESNMHTAECGVVDTFVSYFQSAAQVSLRPGVNLTGAL